MQLERIQDRRIMVFCPEFGERQEITWFLEGYLKENFPKYSSRIAIQGFETIYQPKGVLTVGSLDEREILYIIDPHSSPGTGKINPQEIVKAKSDYNGWRKASYETSVRIIREKDIPFIEYKGYFSPIRNGKEVKFKERESLRNLFAQQFEIKSVNGESVREKMLRRLKSVA